MGGFDRKTVVVTGGEGGIGRACVERFCVKGARVGSLDVREGGRARPDAAWF